MRFIQALYLDTFVHLIFKTCRKLIFIPEIPRASGFQLIDNQNSAVESGNFIPKLGNPTPQGDGGGSESSNLSVISMAQTIAKS